MQKISLNAESKWISFTVELFAGSGKVCNYIREGYLRQEKGHIEKTSQKTYRKYILKIFFFNHNLSLFAADKLQNHSRAQLYSYMYIIFIND